MEKEFMYIYNPVQAKFFANSGNKVLEIGKGAKGDIYLKFLKDDKFNDTFAEWVQRKK